MYRRTVRSNAVGLGVASLVVAALCLTPAALRRAHAQQPSGDLFQVGGRTEAAKQQWVTFVDTGVQRPVPINQPTMLGLQFHIADGYHVNSHTPKSDLLIPTTLTLDTNPRFTVIGTQYPAGHPVTLAENPKEPLDVYTGDVVLKARVLVQGDPNPVRVTGTLHYQACNNNQCFPPKNLPVQFTLRAVQ